MSIGEKLKESRKKAGLSQEQLAEKLCVSRQAITKWESDRGMPDIGNLQSISKLFGVSIDYMLDDGETLLNTVIKESINIDDYGKPGKCRSRYDAIVRSKYPKATIIYPLIRSRKLSLAENIVDFIVQPGVLQVADSLNDMSAYYLVELEQKQLLVNVTKEFIESRELNCKFTEKKRVIGNNLFKKISYTI
ncbi:helix-turn-helix domain-containing protein [[Clostridium] fimetarium]|uniref:DNA-binding transcriptional regulator, XRE-family HTH domain n=1 Tax=[Clostridium] fimetarium TaxID=99656 RepID=A0A1I0MCF3_9FIRM|nr:helix-turn-helix transcriptional regulator [[Clostridium] fimetarium]SEV85654.1 DNA-binding transcriptional regulator, XRE-family HTH domain [[Clostridium] fimetarium]